MKILIINPPIRDWAAPNCVPLGLGYIASVLRNANHEISVLDINAYRYPKEIVEEKIQTLDYDFVATGGLITTVKYITWLLKTIKKYKPDVKIMVGGSVSTSIPTLLLQNTEADIACIGEGEITVVKVADAVEKNITLKEIEGIYYKDGRGNVIQNKMRSSIEDLDSIPFPAYDLFPMDIYVNNPVGYINRSKWVEGEKVDVDVPKSSNINVTRGCPYRCIFCYHDFLGAGYRHHSPEYILSEMKYLYEKYGVTYFLWSDDESVINKHFINDLCDLMIKEKSGFEFCIAGRVNLVDREMLSKLKAAGCNMVGYGIESGSQKILNSIKKSCTIKQTKNAIEMTKEIFGDVDTSFVIGFPDETENTIKETIELCKEVNLTPEVIFFATPYPGTELYRYAIKKGLIKDEWEYVNKLWEQGEQILVNFTEWSDDELFKIRENMIEILGAWNRQIHSRGDNV